MTKFNTFDEGIINADLDTVYDAMLLEFGGNKGWWKKYWESTPIGNKPITESGGSINITVHDIIDGNFSARTISIIKQERLDIEFYEGDFLGHATWLWKADGSRTIVSQEWHASPNSLKFSVASKIVNIEKIHSKVITCGFIALNKFLEEA